MIQRDGSLVLLKKTAKFRRLFAIYCDAMRYILLRKMRYKLAFARLRYDINRDNARRAYRIEDISRR